MQEVSNKKERVIAYIDALPKVHLRLVEKHLLIHYLTKRLKQKLVI